MAVIVACTALGFTANGFQLVSTPDTSQEAPAGAGGNSAAPIISADGRYVLFVSTANNLVLTSSSNPIPAFLSPKLNVFLRDRASATTALASANLAGTGGGNGDSMPSEISTNGQYALFESSASDLVAGDTNSAADIFVRDLVSNTTLLVSVSTNGGFANGACRGSAMTPDGRYVAFVSAANNLVAGDTNGIADVFVRDLQTATTTLVSVGARATTASPSTSLNSSESPEITPDGRYVAFFSTATNLVAGARAVGEIFVRDLVAGTTAWASTNAQYIFRPVFTVPNIAAYNHAISADGRFVAFEASTNRPTSANDRGIVLRYDLLTGLTDTVHTNTSTTMSSFEEVRSLDMTPDGRFIMFVARTNASGFSGGDATCVLRWDAQTLSTALISVNLSNRVSVAALCDYPVIDPSGRYVAFWCRATDMVTNVLSGQYHLFLRDTQAGTTRIVNVDTNGVGSSVGAETVPRLSEDGRLVAFDCVAGSLISNDRNHVTDVFIRDVTSGVTELISAHHPALPTQTPNASSMAFSINGDGQSVAFSSDADNLVAGDTNGCRDVFVRDLRSGTNILVSADTSGIASGNGPSTEPAISGEGRYVAFTSSATNLVAGDNNKSQDVFLRDFQAATTALISVNSGGTGPGNNDSYSPSISADGRWVLFRSKANNLASGSFTGTDNLFLHDIVSATNYALTTSGTFAASMTPNGSFIAYTAGNVVYVWDSQAGARISTNTVSPASYIAISPDGNRLAYAPVTALIVADRVANTNWTIANGFSGSHPGLRFTADGRFLAYANTASEVPVDTNNTYDVYLYDFQTGSNSLVSHSYSAGAANGSSDWPDISADGRFVAYRSAATNIVTGDSNTVPDIFLYDRITDTTSLLSESRFGSWTADNRSLAPLFSGDGRSVVFQSWASDLVAQDFNQASDVFAFGFFYAAIVLGMPAEGPTISWSAMPGRNYRVEFKNAFTNTLWQEVAGSVTIVGNRGYLTDPAPAVGQRFYRVVAF